MDARLEPDTSSLAKNDDKQSLSTIRQSCHQLLSMLNKQPNSAAPPLSDVHDVVLLLENVLKRRSVQPVDLIDAFTDLQIKMKIIIDRHSILQISHPSIRRALIECEQTINHYRSILTHQNEHRSSHHGSMLYTPELSKKNKLEAIKMISADNIERERSSRLLPVK